MSTSEYLDKGNVHLDMELSATLPYHEVVASLVAKHGRDGARILDIGCGLGHIEAEIGKRDKDIVVDVADAYDSCLEATLSRGNVGRTFKIDELTCNLTDSIEETYDIIVMSHVLEHIVFPAKALDEAMSILKPSGKLIVAVPNPVRPSVFLSNLFKIHYVNRGHVHAWDRSHWKNFLEVIMGFNVLEYHTDFIQLPRSTKISLLRKIGKILVKAAPWWGFSNIAVISKEGGGDSVYSSWKEKSLTDSV